MKYYDNYEVYGLENKEVAKEFAMILLENCNYVSLVYCVCVNKEYVCRGMREAKRLLSPFEVESNDVYEWPGTITASASYKYNLVVYKVDSDFKKIFSRFVEKIGLWDWDYPHYPKDPCFYKDDNPMFYLTTHEHINNLYLLDEEGYPTVEELENIGLKLYSSRKVSEECVYSRKSRSNNWDV